MTDSPTPTPPEPNSEPSSSTTTTVEYAQLNGDQILKLASIAAFVLIVLIGGLAYTVVEAQRASVCPTEEVDR